MTISPTTRRLLVAAAGVTTVAGVAFAGASGADPAPTTTVDVSAAEPTETLVDAPPEEYQPPPTTVPATTVPKLDPDDCPGCGLG
jgi:hypothetical protein